MMNLQEWLNLPIEDIDDQITKAQYQMAVNQDILTVLNAVKRLRTANIEPELQPEGPPKQVGKRKPKCFGDFQVWDPQEDKCKGCVFLDGCSRKCADGLPPPPQKP